MEVDVLPLAVAAMPDASLLRLHGARHAVAVDVLREADVGDAGGFVPDQVDVGVEQDGVDRLLPLRQSVLKVEAVEVGSLHQVPQSLGLKGREAGVTDLRVRLKVSVVDGLDQLLGDFDDLLLTSSHVLVLDGSVGTLAGLLVSVSRVVDNCGLRLQ